MKTIVELDNNYYLEIVNNTNNLPTEAIDIEKLNFSNVLKKNIFLIKINFDNLDRKQYKRILKKLLFIRNMISKSKVKIGKIEE